MINKLGLITVIFVLAACSNVKDQALPVKANDPAFAEIGKKLDDNDKRLLIGYLTRRAMATAFGSGLRDEAKTVGAAISAQKEWADKQTKAEAAAAELKTDVELKRKAVAEQISRAVTIAFIKASYHPAVPMSGMYDDYAKLDFAVKNTSPKAIKAVKGMAIFTDTFGDVYLAVPMRFEEAVAPGEQKTIKLAKKINKFMDVDQKLIALDGTKTFKFVPEQIVFSGGETVKAPDAPD